MFVVKEAQVQVLGEEMHSPSKTSVLSMSSDVQEADVETGMLNVEC